jgi:hypothetical protein
MKGREQNRGVPGRLTLKCASGWKGTRRGSMQLLCELSDPIEPRDELILAPDFDVRMMC